LRSGQAQKLNEQFNISTLSGDSLNWTHKHTKRCTEASPILCSKSTHIAIYDLGTVRTPAASVYYECYTP